MKKTIFLPLLVIIAIHGHAQTVNKWLFIGTSSNDYQYFADTLKTDILTPKNFDEHNNVVVFWIKSVRVRKIKGLKVVDKIISKIAVDTINNQIEFKSNIQFKNNRLIYHQDDDDLIEWKSVIPDSMMENAENFSKAISSQQKWSIFIINAFEHDIGNKSYKNY